MVSIHNSKTHQAYYNMTFEVRIIRTGTLKSEERNWDDKKPPVNNNLAKSW